MGHGAMRGLDEGAMARHIARGDILGISPARGVSNASVTVYTKENLSIY